MFSLNNVTEFVHYLLGLECPGTAGWIELELGLLELEGEGFWHARLAAELLLDILSSQV